MINESDLSFAREVFEAAMLDTAVIMRVRRGTATDNIDDPGSLSDGMGGVIGKYNGEDGGHFENQPPTKCRLQIGGALPSFGENNAEASERILGTVVLPFDTEITESDRIIVTTEQGETLIVEVTSVNRFTNGFTKAVSVIIP